MALEIVHDQVFTKDKNSAEVDIAPAFAEITTACNVGQAKKGHGACLKTRRKFSRLDTKY